MNTRPLALAMFTALLVVGCAKPAVRTSDGAKLSAATMPSSRPVLSDQWEKEISAFEAADRAQPMPKDAIVFYGSSSMRMWSTLATDFPGLPVVNRGFGGSRVDDATRYLDRVIIPNRPATLVIYAGDNDLASGRSPERVAYDVRELVRAVHTALPETRIIYLAVKPSPSRFTLLKKMQFVNREVAEMAERDPKLDFVDVAKPMLDANGQPRPELYREDQLHMTPAGYELWTKVLAPVLRQGATSQPK